MQQRPRPFALLLCAASAFCIALPSSVLGCAVHGKTWVHAPDDAEIANECEKEEVENDQGEKEEQCKPRQLVGNGRESME